MRGQNPPVPRGRGSAAAFALDDAAQPLGRHRAHVLGQSCGRRKSQASAVREPRPPGAREGTARAALTAGWLFPGGSALGAQEPRLTPQAPAPASRRSDVRLLLGGDARARPETRPPELPVGAALFTVEPPGTEAPEPALSEWSRAFFFRFYCVTWSLNICDSLFSFKCFS